MGWFSKKQQQHEVVHPRVERIVYVPAPLASVQAHLDSYSSHFSPRRSDVAVVTMAESGGWSAIRLPDAVHPWQLHNLAFWMLDCPHVDGDVIARSAAGSEHGRYRLLHDPEVPDALCGWDEHGVGWTVHVPGNDIVRGEDVPVERSMAVPNGFDHWTEYEIRLEDPGSSMNPTNAGTVRSRGELHRTADVVGG